MNRTLNFIERISSLLKGDPILKTGMKLIYIGVGIIGVSIPTFSIEKSGFSFSLSDSTSGLSYAFGTIAFCVGLVMIIHRYSGLSKNPAVVYYGQGMPNMDDKAPIYALPRIDRYFARDVNLSEVDSYDKSTLLEEIPFYQRLFTGRTEHKNAPTLYLSALGSFPYLFILGTLLRNAHNAVRILDHARNAPGGNMWHLLDPHSDDIGITHIVREDESRTYTDAAKDLAETDNQEVGIALSYTFDISRNELPESLRNSTLILTHSLGHGLDKLSNEAIQEKLLSELTVILNLLSKNRQRVHLFVAAQASMCINIGKCYQDNAHGTLELYNYTRDQGYNWSISYNQGEFS